MMKAAGQTCAADGCEKEAKARGLCGNHYSYWLKKDTTRPRTSADRFWAKVDKSGDCWLWQGATNGKYGRLRRDLVWHYAHRFAYELERGPIPEGMTIDHLCREKLCCNPAHLEVVTLRENILRSESASAIHARKKVCFKGHEFDRTRIKTNGRPVRWCSVCERERAKARAAGANGKGRLRNVEPARSDARRED